MEKLDLRRVTLLGVDNKNVQLLDLTLKHCCRMADFGAVRAVTDAPIRSAEDYSAWCLKKMIEYVDTEFALIVQWDGFICNPAMWTDEYFDYDYIGARWWYETRNVGNGGFNLRSRKLIEAVTVEHVNWDRLHPEDDRICRGYGEELEQKYGIRFAPEELANKFSVETQHVPGYTFGFHRHWHARQYLQQWAAAGYHPFPAGLYPSE